MNVEAEDERGNVVVNVGVYNYACAGALECRTTAIVNALTSVTGR